MGKIMAETELKSFELKKHVCAIHSSNHLTLIQRKIANALLYHAYDKLRSHDSHEIHVENLRQLIGYESKDSKKVKDALRILVTTSIEWNLVDKDKADGEGVWNISSIIADASIDGPICHYSYSNKMRELLHRPEFYGRLNMRVLSQFKSTYGIALYENCVRYQNISQTPWFSMDVFRKLMGVEQGKYKIFRDFKRRVLDKAIQEVNQFSTFTIDVKMKKMGREAVALKFFINKSTAANLTATQVSSGEKNLENTLEEEFGFSPKQINECLTHYEEEYILEKIAVVESSTSYKNGKIVNLAKYLEKAIVENYQKPKSSAEVIDNLHSLSKMEKANKKNNENDIAKYLVYSNKEILKLYGGLDSLAKKQINSKFSQYIRSTPYFDVYEREGINNILVSDRLCEYIKSNKREILESHMSFEEFKKEQAS